MATVRQPKPVFFPQNKSEQKTENPYDPYKIWSSKVHFSPFMLSHKMLHTWFEMHQKFWQSYWEWNIWQHKAMMEAYFQSSRWIMHSMQLTHQPNVLFRYLRANWQKPFMGFNAQALNSARMLTHMLMENGSYFQKSMSSMMKEKQSQTHH